jgi:hypothetical protein
MRALFLSLCCMLVLLCSTSFQPADDWTPLLDKDLSKWKKYQSFKHAVGDKGEIPKDANGNPLKPVGYNVNKDNEFSVSKVNGELILKIGGEIYGCLVTKQDFTNYDLKFKVKWGSKKWPPRLDEVKDSGLLYHSQGECGADYWHSWMLSQEFQVAEKGMGDYWSQASSRADAKARKEGNDYFFDHNGTLTEFGGGTAAGNFCHAGTDAEKKDDWNELELITYGDKSIRLVNGQVVMALSNSRNIVNGKAVPLVSGKLQLQCESAEVYYKDILIKPINSMPAQYAGYFK